MAHTSKHLKGRKITEIERDFKPEHLDAGYHLQFFGEHATPDHDLLGTYETPQGRIVVEYTEDVPEGAGGPEFKLTLPNEDVVTVLGADVVEAYLEQYA